MAAPLPDLETISTQYTHYFMDDFRNHGHIAIYGAGTCTPHQLRLQVGGFTTGLSTAQFSGMNYNPLYGSLFFKFRIDQLASSGFFFGFNETPNTFPPAVPTLPLGDGTWSYAGILYRLGVLYFVTGSGDPVTPVFQATPIPGCDITRELVFQLTGNKCRYYSLPVAVPYFDVAVEPGLKQALTRKWSPWYVNGSARPGDRKVYINTTLYNDSMNPTNAYISFMNYSEVYPD